MKNTFSQLVAAVLITTLTFSGCSKSSSNSGNNNSNGTVNGLIATTTEKNSTGGVTMTIVTSYSYDGQNRLTGFNSTSGTSATFAYGTGTVTEVEGATTTVYTLNSAGQAVSDDQGNTYTYDNNGYLLSKINSSGASVVNTISNGNVTSSDQTTGGVTTDYNFTFNSTRDYRSIGDPFLGSSNVDLVQTETVPSLGIGPLTFSYTLDSEGRVSNESYTSGSSTISRSYTYESN